MTPYKNSRSFPAKVDLIVFDFDGVFTDNTVIVDETGKESVVCSRGDGLGIDLLRDAGVPMLILSKEPNPVVAARAKKLRIPVSHGCDDKKSFLEAYFKEHGYRAENTIYVGNDINDIEAMNFVGFGAAPRDSHPKVLEIADTRLEANGGRGAVRELAELVLEKT